VTQASLPSPSFPGRRRAAREREFRRIGILATAPAGWSYAAIGREEAISRERAPQIVASAFEAGDSETKLVHARASGRLNRYAAIDAADAADRGGGRKRRLAKLNAMAENLEQRRERHGEAAPGEADSTDAEAALDATDSPDFVDDPAAPSSAGLDIA
jgi:hypothetical protein